VQIAFTVQTSWPQFGFTPNHKAKNHYENVLSAANVINLDQAWRTPYIGPVHDTPAIVNGIVYAAFNDGTIRAFNEITGAQQWSYKTGGLQMESSPDVANGIVYAGSDDDYLYALDAVIGALKWRYQTGGAVSCSPNAVNGIVYFGSLDEKLYALNATTGKLIWSFAAGGLVTPSPMVANGVVYVTADTGNLYALNAATGAQIWKSSTTGFSTTPMLVGGLIYIGSESGSMYALHSADGTEAWAYSTGQDAIASAPAAVGGAIFFGGENGSVYSLSTEGAFRWSTPLSTGGAIKSPVCVANGVVYASDGSYIYGLDQDTGAILATLPAGASPGGPVVVNGAVFTGDSYDDGLARYTLEGMSSNFVAPRPEPMQLRPHPLR
jgi:outer membrane protein assembly factor BamB